MVIFEVIPSQQSAIIRYYTLLIPIFRFFIQPMSSKLFVSKERKLKKVG
ncbi:MAG: hypothetical protein [Olavius algarvensis Gamma 1 endosymbiont]|nr:MAG: hypothetical protein [Olavius algarvensis Gamma 1 endosymbiont]